MGLPSPRNKTSDQSRFAGDIEAAREWLEEHKQIECPAFKQSGVKMTLKGCLARQAGNVHHNYDLDERIIKPMFEQCKKSGCPHFKEDTDADVKKRSSGQRYKYKIFCKA